MADMNVSEPFPISLVGGRYIVYDVDTVSHIRRVHNITGVLIGGLPQAPQQNVFSGIPLELMPEEARLLVEKNVAYIIDDAAAHKDAFLHHNLSVKEKAAFLKSMDRQGKEASKAQQKSAEDRKSTALKKIAAKNTAASGDWNDIPEDMLAAATGPRGKAKKKNRSRPDAMESLPGSRPGSSAASVVGDDDSLFGGSAAPTPVFPSPAVSEASGPSYGGMKITPTTSQPPLRPQPPPRGYSMPLPQVPQSYPLFKHLHAQNYFMAPGIRFGCQYMAYPGDPLRFHSHFLCDGMDWDQEFDLLGLVGGGRLGTGVKKGFLIGGEEKNDDDQDEEVKEDRVRPFCIEWAGM